MILKISIKVEQKDSCFLLGSASLRIRDRIRQWNSSIFKKIEINLRTQGRIEENGSRILFLKKRKKSLSSDRNDKWYFYEISRNRVYLRYQFQIIILYAWESCIEYTINIIIHFISPYEYHYFLSREKRDIVLTTFLFTYIRA